MIALHFDVAGDLNEPLATAARHAMFRARCADVCQATSRLAVRRAGQNIEVLRAMLELGARVCDLCADECQKHHHEHCKLCATMYRECIEDCRKALPTVN